MAIPMDGVTGIAAGFMMTHAGIMMEEDAGIPTTATVITAIMTKTPYPSGTCRLLRQTGNMMNDPRG
jgi:hypothetical protein